MHPIYNHLSTNNNFPYFVLLDAARSPPRHVVERPVAQVAPTAARGITAAGPENDAVGIIDAVLNRVHVVHKQGVVVQLGLNVVRERVSRKFYPLLLLSYEDYQVVQKGPSALVTADVKF